MATTTVTKIILEINGEERVAVPVSEAELQEAAQGLRDKGIDVFNCDCGQELCWNGYVWRCAYGPSGNCQWFKSDWMCN